MNEYSPLEQAKHFVYRHFERLLVLSLVLSLLLIHNFIEFKLAFLSFYYLPVILAGFLVGRRLAVWAAVFVVCLVCFVQAIAGLESPAGLRTEEILYLLPWGGFLILTGYVVGALAEQRRARTEDVRGTYLTMLELLTLHVDSSDRLRRGHSYRVGARAAELARALGLRERQQEDVRVAGLLHEIGPRDPRLLRVMAETSAASGRRGGTLHGALRLVDEYSHYHEIVSSGSVADDSRISLGAKILAVADAFETLQTPTATRQAFAPWTALGEIERGAGVTFASEVVKALRSNGIIDPAESTTGQPEPVIRLA